MVIIECMRFTAPGSCLFLWLKKELDSDYTLLDPSVARQTIPPSLYLWDIWKMFDQNIQLSYLITLWHEVKCHHHQWFPKESSLFCAEVSLKYLWRFDLMNTVVLVKHSHQTVILIKGGQYQEKNEVTFNKFGHPEGTKMHLVLYS